MQFWQLSQGLDVDFVRVQISVVRVLSGLESSRKFSPKLKKSIGFWIVGFSIYRPIYSEELKCTKSNEVAM